MEENKVFNFNDLFLTTKEVSNEILTAFQITDKKGKVGPIVFAMSDKATDEDAKNITIYLRLFGDYEVTGAVNFINNDKPSYLDYIDEPTGKYFITNLYSIKDTFSDYQYKVIKEFVESYEDVRGNLYVNTDNNDLMIGWLL